MLGPSFWLFQTASKVPQKESILDEEIGPGRFSTVERIAEYVRCKLDGRPVPPERGEEVLRTIIEGAYEGTIEKIVHL